MKFFVMIFVAPLMALTKADISLNTGHSYNNNNNVPNVYYMQHQHLQNSNQQPPYPSQYIIPDSFLKPSTQYLPQPQPILPQQHKHNQQQPIAMQYPMPADFPSMFSFQPSLKPARHYRPRSRATKKPIVTKHFYIHSAPEETEAEIEEELATLQQQPRKHYNVLFVKTPSQTNKAAALNLARALKEEKTVVYVLAKKTSAADLQDAVQAAPQNVNKPEVFFIKYRTPEEASNAQLQIQSQYDSLGGSTTITDEGTAPATSVIGSLDAPDDDDADEEEYQPLPLDNSQEQAKTTDHYDEPHSMHSLPHNGYLPPQQY